MINISKLLLTVVMAIQVLLSDGALSGKETGIYIRIPQQLTDTLKNEICSFIPIKEISYPIIFPKEISYQLYKFWFMYFNIFANNFRATNLVIETDDFSFDFLKQQSSTNPEINLLLPVLHSWMIEFDLSLVMTFQFQIIYNVKISLDEITSALQLSISSDSEGQLVPVVEKFDYQIEKMKIEVQNDFLAQWLANIYVKIMAGLNYILINQIGVPILNVVLPTITQNVLQKQIMNIPVDIPQLENLSQFKFDYRFTSEPKYTYDSIQLYLLGELLTKSMQQCNETHNPSRNYDFITSKSLNKTLSVIITNRTINCGLRALEASSFNNVVLSSESITKSLDFNLTINVELVSSFIPGFGSELPSDTEIQINLFFWGTKVSLVENDGQMSMSGFVLCTFLQAANKGRVYHVQLGYTAGISINITTTAHTNYTIISKINQLEVSVISDPKEIDPNYLDYQISENLNNILGFLQRYANKVILDDGIVIANPLNSIFLNPTIKVKNGAIYGYLDVEFL